MEERANGTQGWLRALPMSFVFSASDYNLVTSYGLIGG